MVIIRHAKVDFLWNNWCTSEEFDKECREYDKALIKDIDFVIPHFKYQRMYVSTFPQSRNTAMRLFPEASLKETELINEVPLKSGFDTEKKLPLWFWSISGSLQWIINVSRQPEGRSRTKMRARRFVDTICRDNSNCIVVTHGFYMHILLREMKKAGFRTSKLRLAHKNGEYVVAEK